MKFSGFIDSKILHWITENYMPLFKTERMDNFRKSEETQIAQNSPYERPY